MTTHSNRLGPNSWTSETRLIVDAFLLDAVRLEGRAALDVVAGDISHEIAHTLNFLRCLVDAGSDLPALSSEDASLAQREVERLQRILSHLRRLKLPPPEREPVRFLPILRRAEAEIADLILAKRITTSFLIGQNVALLADPRLLYILVRDALATVVRRVAPSSTVEVRADLPEGPNPGRVEVLWTGGRAMLPSQSDLDALFDPWAETVDGTANLGLSVPFRIARVFGWKLSTIGDVGCDGLRITIPPDAFALESGR